MEQHEHHHMELVRVDVTGEEEWLCPTCGRHFLLRWPPNYSKTIIAAGDDFAIHSGGKGGLSMGAPAVLDADTYLPDPGIEA